MTDNQTVHEALRQHSATHLYGDSVCSVCNGIWPCNYAAKPLYDRLMLIGIDPNMTVTDFKRQLLLGSTITQVENKDYSL